MEATYKAVFSNNGKFRLIFDKQYKYKEDVYIY